MECNKSKFLGNHLACSPDFYQKQMKNKNPLIWAAIALNSQNFRTFKNNGKYGPIPISEICCGHQIKNFISQAINYHLASCFQFICKPVIFWPWHSYLSGSTKSWPSSQQVVLCPFIVTILGCDQMWTLMHQVKFQLDPNMYTLLFLTVGSPEAHGCHCHMALVWLGL